MEDLTNINWQSTSGFTGTQGCYYKSKISINNKLFYYKLSSFNEYDGFFGHESINEVIVSRLCDILGINCVSQKLVNCKVRINNVLYNTYACKSLDYKQRDSRLTCGELVKYNRLINESPLQTLNRLGFSEFTNTLFLLDFLIIDRDRHDANIEFLVDKNNNIKPAPIFDSGLSLLAPLTTNVPNIESMVRSFNPFEDRVANNFLGSRSLEENLKYITKPIRVNTLKLEHKRKLFYGVHDTLPDFYIEKIWEIICSRYLVLRKYKLILEV